MRFCKNILTIFFSIILWTIVISPGNATTTENSTLNNIKYFPEQRSFSLYSDSVLKPQIKQLKDPVRIVIDLPETIFPPVKKEININDSKIKKIRVSQFQNNPYVVRVVVDLKTSLEFDIQNNIINEDHILTFLFTKNEVIDKAPEKKKNLLKKIEIKDNKIVLSSFHEIKPRIKKLKNSQEYIVDIPGLNSNNIGQIPLDLNAVKNIQLVSKKNNTRIHLKLYNDFKLSANLAEDGKELELLINKTKIEKNSLDPIKIIQKDDKHLKVILKNSKPFDYNLYGLSEPNRIVIDTMGVDLDGVPEYNRTQSSILNNIRFGRLSDDKREGLRIVFDLNEQVIYQSRFSKDRLTLEIYIKSIPSINKKNFNKLIVLDPGHGGVDPGAVGQKNNYEKDVVLDVSRYLRRILENNGFKVILTRKNDSEVLLQPRVDIANNANADLFISLHCNAVDNKPHIKGVETYYNSDQGKKLAAEIQKQIVKNLNAVDRSIRHAGFYVIKNTDMPAVLVEMGYITNQLEEEKLINASYQRKLAESIFNGIKKYLEKEKALKELNM